MTPVTRILTQIESGDSSASEQLLPLVYEELRQLARQRLAHERPGQTLQATALVHEAYLRLIGTSEPTSWDSRGHFFAAAAEAMRRILVDEARRRGALKRGGNAHRVPLEDDILISTATGSPEELLALDEALKEFETIDPIRSRVIKLRYFAGFSLPQTAEALGISHATARRHWIYSRSWLFGKMRGDRKP